MSGSQRRRNAPWRVKNRRTTPQRSERTPRCRTRRDPNSSGFDRVDLSRNVQGQLIRARTEAFTLRLGKFSEEFLDGAWPHRARHVEPMASAILKNGEFTTVRISLQKAGSVDNKSASGRSGESSFAASCSTFSATGKNGGIRSRFHAEAPGTSRSSVTTKSSST
jgi:hypothetical protein